MAPALPDAQDPPIQRETSANYSSLACGTCRRRKAKCDRRFPSCLVCEKTMQTCSYPTSRLKSGPKIGSTHRKKKFARFGGDKEKSPRDNEEDSVCNIESHTNSKRDKSPPSNKNTCMTSSVYSKKSNRVRQNRSDTLFSDSNSILSHTSPPEIGNDHPLNSLDGIRLSYIVHPTHDTNVITPSSDSEDETPEHLTDVVSYSEALSETCCVLNISRDTMQRLISAYFNNMTAFSMFHQPSFHNKLRDTKNASTIGALLAAMFSFSARFETKSSARDEDVREPREQQASEFPSYGKFHELASDLIDKAISECGDGMPSLCLLQALVLNTFYELTRGVRGKAWRRLGLCVNIAYEKHLHLIDAEKTHQQFQDMAHDLPRWCLEEERRRLWWALWEMDVFASTIKRSKTAIDPTTNKTFLPVPDECWFEQIYHSSCFLAISSTDRWKVLQKTGNTSPAAWFIVVNSLMLDAHILSNPEVLACTSSKITVDMKSPRASLSPELVDGLTILDHTLRCFSLALPEQLQWHGEILSFSSENPSNVLASKRLHSAKYSIHMMSQLAKFMVYQQFVYSKDGLDRDYMAGVQLYPQWSVNNWGTTPIHQGLSRYLEASNNILAIVNSCAEDHCRNINPFLASTIWLASVVQLVYKRFGGAKCNKELVDSKADILWMQFKQYSKFWGIQNALPQNFESVKWHLENNLDSLTRSSSDSQGTEVQIEDSEATKKRKSRGISSRISAKRIRGGELAPCLDFTGGFGEALPSQEPTQIMNYSNDDFNPSNLDTLLQRNYNTTTQAENSTRVSVQNDFSGLFDQDDIGIMEDFWGGMELEFGNL